MFFDSAHFWVRSALFPLLFLYRRTTNAMASTDGQPQQLFVFWNPPTLPTADIFFSPCTFPMVYPFGSRRRHRTKQTPYDHGNSHQLRHIAAANGDDSLCHVNRRIPFICDLHRALRVTDRDALRLACVHQRHAAVLHDNASSSPTFVVLIVRQLAQPTLPVFVIRNSTEFGCLFRLPCETMGTEMVHKFVKNPKAFMRLYASVLFYRWHEHRCPLSSTAADLSPNSSSKETAFHGTHPPMVLAIGLTTNPRRITSVTLHSDNQLFPFLVNTQNECTNMLMQGIPLIDVLIELTSRVGHAVRDFRLTKGRPRRHIVPMWAWTLTMVAVSLVLLALVAEWAMIRKVRTRKTRAIELGGIKAVVKSKTHIIF